MRIAATSVRIASLFIVLIITLTALLTPSATATIARSANQLAPATDMQSDLPTQTLAVSIANTAAVTTASGVASEAATELLGATSSVESTLDLSGTPYAQIAALVAAQLIPAGGRELIDLPTAYAITSDPGYSFLALGHGLIAQDTVISFQIIWYLAGPTSACGLRFRVNDSDPDTSGQSTLLLTNDGQVVLMQQQGKVNLINYRQPSALFSPKTINTVTIVAVGDTVRLYLNGTLQTIATGKAARGGFAFELYNPKDNKIVTECRFRHIWIWTFDSTKSSSASLTPTLTPNPTLPATENPS